MCPISKHQPQPIMFDSKNPSVWSQLGPRILCAKTSTSCPNLKFSGSSIILYGHLWHSLGALTINTAKKGNSICSIGPFRAPSSA
jgi:hypothetical protein